MSGIEAAAAEVQAAVAAGTEQAIQAAQADQERQQAIEAARGEAGVAMMAAADTARETGDLAARLAAIEQEQATWRSEQSAALGTMQSEIAETRSAFQQAMDSLSRLSQPAETPAASATVEVQAATPPPEESPDAAGQASDAPILLSGRDRATGFRNRILRRSGH